jgi:hypothetical protein
MVVTNSLVIPPEITECLNKSEWKQIKLLLGKEGTSAGSTEDVRFGMSEELLSEPGCLQL